MEYHSYDDSDAPFPDSEASVDEEEEWLAELRRIKHNDPDMTDFTVRGEFNESVQNMTDEGWEQLGQDIANNTHLVSLCLYARTLNDHKMSFFFRGLTRSITITEAALFSNGFGVEGVRSMVPFLQNANRLLRMDLTNNYLQSQGFSVLFRALRDSPIEKLSCDRCGIESIEIDNNDVPDYLKVLRLGENSIDADGCRGLVKLLQGGDSTLEYLRLYDNKIDDEGVAILVDAVQNNTALEELDVRYNQGITMEGMRMLLRLVNDISSIKATLNSNHTLRRVEVKDINPDELFDPDVNTQIQCEIDNALELNRSYEDNPQGAGRAKVILTQLHSGAREELASLLGVERSVYSEINPLHLPEVLALVGRRLGRGELYVALKSSIAGLISTANRSRKECIQQQRAYHASKLEELGAELAAINEAEGDAVEAGESRSNKRRRA